MFPLAPEGYPFIAAPAVAGVFAWLFGYPWLAVLMVLVVVACIAFFRDPPRHSIAPPESILAPADGKVLSVSESPRAMADAGLPRQISIFMSPANVHVNRAPVSGRVVEARHVPGAKLPAFRDKASELNEHSFVIIEGAQGRIAYKQIAGSVARRVVCDLKVGHEVSRGQRVGIIKFSSRVDLFLPAAAAPRVSPGDLTRAGETVVAHWTAAEAP
jgi:phosphatidylserine decarboxylase